MALEAGTTPDSTAYNFTAPLGSAHGVITGGRREQDSMRSLSAAADTKMRGTVRVFSFSPQRGSLFPARTLSPGGGPSSTNMAFGKWTRPDHLLLASLGAIRAHPSPVLPSHFPPWPVRPAIFVGFFVSFAII